MEQGGRVMAPIRNVYDHIEQRWIYEDSEPVIRKIMTEYAEKMREQNAERTFWFDMSRTSTERKIVVTPISLHVLVGMHKHDYYEFNIILEGALYEYIENQFFSVQKNELLILHPDVFHSVYPSSDCVGFNILVDKNYFSDMKKELSAFSASALMGAVVDQKHYVMLNVEKNAAIVEEIQKLHSTRQTNSLEIQLLNCRFRELMLLLLLAETEESLSVIGSGSTTYEDKISQITNFIRDNYSTITLNEISRKFGYSPAQVHRILIKYVGSSFSDLVDQYRFNHAARLLKETDIPIEQIGNIVGLEKTYFYRFFKKLGECTPLQYRKLSQIAAERNTEVGALIAYGFLDEFKAQRKKARAPKKNK